MPAIPFRWTTRQVMVAILVVAVGLWWAIIRPYPVIIFSGPPRLVLWSDGSTTVNNGPNDASIRGISWFIIVDFPDGSTRYYFRIRPPTH